VLPTSIPIATITTNNGIQTITPVFTSNIVQYQPPPQTTVITSSDNNNTTSINITTNVTNTVYKSVLNQIGINNILLVCSVSDPIYLNSSTPIFDFNEKIISFKV
jgi:hypothetical protein